MEQREMGWWLPEPKQKYGVDGEEAVERTRRMRAVAVWFLRVAVLSGVCFAGLLYSEAGVSAMGAFFAGALWTCGAVMVVGIFIALVWVSP